MKHISGVSLPSLGINNVQRCRVVTCTPLQFILQCSAVISDVKYAVQFSLVCSAVQCSAVQCMAV